MPAAHLLVATAAFARWKTTGAEERADFLFRAAARIRETKDDWNALLVYESAFSLMPGSLPGLPLIN